MDSNFIKKYTLNKQCVLLTSNTLYVYVYIYTKSNFLILRRGKEDDYNIMKHEIFALGIKGI